MRPDDLLRALRERPFVPFRLHVSDGIAYEIIGPEMAFVERSTVTVGVPIPGQPDVMLNVVVSLLHITRLEPIVRGGAMPSS
jgi:hypothetical protein